MSHVLYTRNHHKRIYKCQNLVRYRINVNFCNTKDWLKMCQGNHISVFEFTLNRRYQLPGHEQDDLSCVGYWLTFKKSQSCPFFLPILICASDTLWPIAYIYNNNCQKTITTELYIFMCLGKKWYLEQSSVGATIWGAGFWDPSFRCIKAICFCFLICRTQPWNNKNYIKTLSKTLTLINCQTNLPFQFSKIKETQTKR